MCVAPVGIGTKRLHQLIEPIFTIFIQVRKEDGDDGGKAGGRPGNCGAGLGYPGLKPPPSTASIIVTFFGTGGALLFFVA